MRHVHRQAGVRDEETCDNCTHAEYASSAGWVWAGRDVQPFSAGTCYADECDEGDQDGDPEPPLYPVEDLDSAKAQSQANDADDDDAHCRCEVL